MKKTLLVFLAVFSLLLLLLPGCEFSSSQFIDLDPTHSEEIAETIIDDSGITVYWTEKGSLYHLDPDCLHLDQSDALCSGTEAQAIEAGKTRVCTTCAKNYAENGD